jgi:putative ABC transport system permease protein
MSNMRTLLKMAWRNIWRNKRRTYITLASILFSVLFASFMESWQKGTWNYMISNVVNFYFGYAQIHKEGYWEEQTLDKAFPLEDSILAITGQIPEIKAVLPRIESFALASTGDNTIGALVIGIDPEVENSMTNLRDRITAGEYLEENDRAAVLAEGLAENLNLNVGDTLVMISQGYRGVNAAGKYPVKGIVHFGSPELNKQMIYLPLKEAQWFYGAPDLVTTLALKIDDQRDIIPALKALKAKLNLEDYEVMDWEELLPDLVEARAFDSVGNYIVYFILYMIIAFGIFGTVLMMAKEREFEFGVLIAIGMHRLALGASVWVEVIILGVLGALAGIIASIPVVWYFSVYPIRFTGEYAGVMEKFGFEPVFPAELDPRHFLLQAIIVLIVTAVLALYPLIKIKRLKPVEAMRG